MRKPLDAFAISLMIGLCVCWGFTQVAVKLIADDVSPMMQMGVRSAVAAVVLGLITLRRDGARIFADGTLPSGLLVGLLFAVEFLFIAQGLTLTSASHLVVFVYSAPIFSALGLALRFREERLSLIQWIGILTAFGGIAVSFLGGGQSVSPQMLLGDAFGLLAGLAWGLTTVAIRGSKLSDAPAVKTLFYQVGMAGVVLMAVAAWNGEFHINPTPEALLNLAYQSVVVSLISYVAWFWLLTKYLASRLSVLSFLTPVFGVMFGVAVLNEPLEPSFILGAAFVLVGVSLTSGAELLRERLARSSA